MTRLAQARRIAPVAVVLALAIRGSAQIIPTDGAPPGQRTGMIVGQVVDATTGAPVAEAIVRLTMPKYLENLPTTPKGRVMADSEGRFFFADLPRTRCLSSLMRASRSYDCRSTKSTVRDAPRPLDRLVKSAIHLEQGCDVDMFTM